MIVPLHPKLRGIAAERFVGLARKVSNAQAGRQVPRFADWAEIEAEWAKNNAALNGQAGQYEGAARLLLDLVMLKWQVRVDAGEIELEAPRFGGGRHLTVEQAQATKDAIRRELEPVLREQFSDSGVLRFIERLENPLATSAKKSISLLIADGAEVAMEIQFDYDPLSHVSLRQPSAPAC